MQMRKRTTYRYSRFVLQERPFLKADTEANTATSAGFKPGYVTLKKPTLQTIDIVQRPRLGQKNHALNQVKAQ